MSNVVPVTPAQDSSRHDIVTTSKPVETLVSNNKPVEPQSVSEILTSSVGKTKKVHVTIETHQILMIFGRTSLFPTTKLTHTYHRHYLFVLI